VVALNNISEVLHCNNSAPNFRQAYNPNFKEQEMVESDGHEFEPIENK
jgi:hypothetical protein